MATKSLTRPTTQEKPSFLHHPQRVWWRAVLFQVHLWAGLILALYVCVIGISGSFVVLEDELTRISRPDLFRPGSEKEAPPFQSLAMVAANVQKQFPEYKFYEVLFPIESEPALQFSGSRRISNHESEFLNVYVDPTTGQILGTLDRHFWLSRIRDLHIRLMAGQAGLTANGCGAALLLLLAITGVVIWWRGVRHWSKALRIDVHRKWSRINFDLHSMAGVWLLFFVLIWAVSGVYFVWPAGFVSLLDSITPTKSAVYPAVRATSSSGKQLAWVNLIEKAQTLNPGLRVLELEPSLRAGAPLVIVLAPDQTFRRATHIFFDPVTGEVLQTWTRGEGRTVGARILPWMADLHFGERWGLGVKLLWAVLGLALPGLAVTGAFMYWNRFLVKKWHRAFDKNRVRRSYAATGNP